MCRSGPGACAASGVTWCHPLPIAVMSQSEHRPRAGSPPAVDGKPGLTTYKCATWSMAAEAWAAGRRTSARPSRRSHPDEPTRPAVAPVTAPVRQEYRVPDREERSSRRLGGIYQSVRWVGPGETRRETAFEVNEETGKTPSPALSSVQGGEQIGPRSGDGGSHE